MSKDNSEGQQKNKPASNERAPGQGNSSDGLTRRLGADTEDRAIKDQEKLHDDITGEDDRPREGSQGVSKGQRSND